MDLCSPLHVPNQHNHLYCKPSHLENPSNHGERVQYEKKEFTAWMNDYLQHVPHCKCISDLQEDLADGITLLYFVQQISYESPPCVHQNPALYVHRVENTEACLLFLDRLGVDLRGVHAEDVVSGNIKTVLALCRAMQIRFQGDMLEDHRCLSPVLSWKQKSLSPSLSASLSSAGFTWPQTSLRQEGELTSSRQEESVSPGNGTAAGCETSSNSIFTVWYKEDMAVFSWVKRLLGIELKDYSEFADGILLCAIVNQLWDESVTQEEVLYSTPRERLEIATEAAEQFLGVPRNEVDLKAVIDGQGKDGLPWYLLDLKAASEQMMTQHLAMAEEKDRMRNEEETVSRMRRQLIRQYSRDNDVPLPTVDSSRRSQTNQKPQGVSTGYPTDKRWDGTFHRNDNFQRNGDFQRNATKSSPTTSPPERQISDQRRTETESISDRRSADTSPPALPHQKTREVLGFDGSTDVPERAIAQDRMQEMEELETSLSSLMKPNTRRSSLLEPEAGEYYDSEISDDAPLLLQQTSNRPPDASPAEASHLQRDNPPRVRNQPDVSRFFSPFSMPFLSTASRTDARTRIGNSMRNTSSGLVDDDNLARDKLTTWNDKEVLRNQGHESPLKEPDLPQKPLTISATMMARLAARSPGGVAGMNSSDSDD